MKSDAGQTIKLKQIFKVGSECGLIHGLMPQSVKSSE